MLTIHGINKDTDEYKAGLSISDSIVSAMPGIKESTEIFLEIFPNAQCLGEKSQAIDLLILFADFRQELFLQRTSCQKIVHSFSATLKVDFCKVYSDVFAANGLFNDFHNGHHKIKLQIERQKKIAVRHIKRSSKDMKKPHITDLAWLPNISPEEAGAEQNILGGDFNWRQLLEKISCVDKKSKKRIQSFACRKEFASMVSAFDFWD